MDKYEKLEETIVDCRTAGGGKQKGLVVGVDPDIGITLVNTENHNEYITCLIGPGSPIWKKNYNKKRYRATFELIVRQLKEGRYNELEVDKMRENNFNSYHSVLAEGANFESCPFGQ